ncbi:Serine/threonine-protein phosphatase 6 regulatory subunit 2 [Geodia barretti]|uniref:Serine/threonine-protein phosphatase 6 regulatory subunit 2 n=1 Tax=Geodia barretti TaxID=519541 RepID=A0AA35WX65_GEOBA|nr:Serine/threonine-protein phosphatase 6 regulatory subunit 2 [Geodia barretti]
MFWKLTFRPPSAVDTLLNEEQCSLHDILDEDNVLQELKSQNKKLVDFFLRPEILEQLVKMVTLEPEHDAEDKVKFNHVSFSDPAHRGETVWSGRLRAIS